EVIIEHKLKDNFDTAGAYRMIEELSASFIQIRFLEYSMAKIDEILSFIEFSSIQTVEILIPFNGIPQDLTIIKKLEINPR
ncbi:hypothetical protein, partial [Bacillus sp. SIMBA_033]